MSRHLWNGVTARGKRLHLIYMDTMGLTVISSATPDQRSSSMLDELAFLILFPSLSYPSPSHQHRVRIVDGL